jgi:hypothetical protein
MGILSQFALGNALTGLTNVSEEIERTRHTMPIGAGGGLNSLPLIRQRELAEKIPKWLNTLRKHPRHIITRELLKNIKVSEQFGRSERINAQIKLLERLIDDGVALDIEEFAKSYQE